MKGQGGNYGKRMLPGRRKGSEPHPGKFSNFSIEKVLVCPVFPKDKK